MPDNMFNNQQRTTVSTSMLTIWDANQNGVQLRVAGIDAGLSLAIWIPVFSPDGHRSYPREQRPSVILTLKNCEALSQQVTKELLPAYEAGRDYRVGVFSNAATSNMIEIECKQGDFYLHCHQGCDVNTHIPQKTTTFKFETVRTNGNFDPSTGMFEVVPVQADFFIFMKMLNGYVKSASGTVAGHGYRVVNRNSNQQLMDYLRAIANAVHAQLPAPAYQRPQQPSFNPDNPVIGGNTPPPVAMEELNDLSDLYG